MCSPPCDAHHVIILSVIGFSRKRMLIFNDLTKANLLLPIPHYLFPILSPYTLLTISHQK